LQPTPALLGSWLFSAAKRLQGSFTATMTPSASRIAIWAGRASSTPFCTASLARRASRCSTRSVMSVPTPPTLWALPCSSFMSKLRMCSQRSPPLGWTMRTTSLTPPRGLRRTASRMRSRSSGWMKRSQSKRLR